MCIYVYTTHIYIYVKHNIHVYVYIVRCGSITFYAKRDMPMIRDSETSTSIGAVGKQNRDQNKHGDITNMSEKIGLSQHILTTGNSKSPVV